MRRQLSILGLVAVLAGLIPTSGAAQIAPRSSPEWGASVFIFGHPETTQRDLDLLKGAGLTWAKITVPWRSVEPSCKNCFYWDDLDRVIAATSAAGVNVVARIDYPPAWARPAAAAAEEVAGTNPLNGPPDDLYDYADFVQQVARRYAPASPKGTIHAIQVWDEPNLNREWGGAIINRRQAVEYMSMLRQTYELVKQVSPDTIIVSAGLSPTGTNDGTAQPDDVYLDWLYDNDLDRYSDAIGFHGAGYNHAPEDEIGSDPAYPHGSFYFRRVEQLRNIMVARGDANTQIWLMEFGWTTDPIHPDRTFYAVSAEQQADYIVRAFKFARANWAPWIGPVFIWNMADPAWTPEYEQYWWSITNPDGTPRLAYEVLAASRADGSLP